MKKTVTILLCIAVTMPLFAQSKGKGLETVVSGVSDRRTKGSFARLFITVELPKVKSLDVAASRVLIKEAVDNEGNVVLVDEGGEPQLQDNPALVFARGDAGPMQLSMELKTSPRSATSLKVVRGEVELFMPSKDPNSVATVQKFLSRRGKPLSSKALKANGVEVAVLSEQQFEAEKKRLAEVKRVEAKKEGYEGDSLEHTVSSFLEYFYKPEPGEIVLKVKDPNKRVQAISYLDKDGVRKHVMTRDEEGMTVLSTWGEPPQNDWALSINMRTAKNVIRYPFELEDVPLP